MFRNTSSTRLEEETKHMTVLLINYITQNPQRITALLIN